MQKFALTPWTELGVSENNVLIFLVENYSEGHNVDIKGDSKTLVIVLAVEDKEKERTSQWKMMVVWI